MENKVGLLHCYKLPLAQCFFCSTDLTDGHRTTVQRRRVVASHSRTDAHCPSLRHHTIIRCYPPLIAGRCDVPPLRTSVGSTAWVRVCPEISSF